MKTKCMIFSRLQVPPIMLEIENNLIDRLEKFNFLSLEISENLDWSSHTDKLSLNCNRTIGIFKRMRAHVPAQTLRTIYFSLFISHLDFQILAWGYSSDAIFRLQKRQCVSLAAVILWPTPTRYSQISLFWSFRISERLSPRLNLRRSTRVGAWNVMFLSEVRSEVWR